MRYTDLKGRPNSVQAVFVGGVPLLLALFFLGAGWVAAQLSGRQDWARIAQ